MTADSRLTVIIQRLQTCWTKQSRGGQNARRRNAVPEKLPIAALPTSCPCVLQTVRFSEAGDFQPAEQVQILSGLEELNLSDLRLSWCDEGISVRFDRDGFNAARPVISQWTDVFQLGHEEWGQLLYNGRYCTYEGNWWYQKVVYNIALTDTLNRTLFTAAPPDHRFSELVYLR